MDQAEEEEWAWVGVGSLYGKRFSTYTNVAYDVWKQHVDKRFESLKTPDDIKTNLVMLQYMLDSPTGCYLDLDVDDDCNEMFYRDSQDCVRWALEASTGKVYIPQSQGKIYCAKSLGEFFTRLVDEQKTWSLRNARKF